MDVGFILLLACHLLAMNVGAGSPLICVWLEWRARGGRDKLAAAAAGYLAHWSVLALLAGALLGLLLGAMLWTDDYRQLWLTRLSRKMNVGLMEFGFSLAMLAGYWLWRASGRGRGSTAAAIRILLVLLAGTNLLYHFPALFLVARRLHDAGATAGATITPGLFRQEMIRGEVPALAVHFSLASLAVAGIMLLGLALRQRRRGGSDEDYERLCRWGGRIALVPTLLQLPVGLWVLTSLPAASQSRLMGSQLMATGCFLLSVFGALWLMRELAAIALGEHERSQIARTMALMAAVVILMTASQHYARVPAAPATEPQAAAPSLSAME